MRDAGRGPPRNAGRPTGPPERVGVRRIGRVLSLFVLALVFVLPVRAAETVAALTASTATASYGGAVTFGAEIEALGGGAAGGTIVLRDGSAELRRIGLSVRPTAQPFAVGADHACAVVASGGVACWGANGSGRLGDGTTVDRPSPVAVVGLGDVVAIGLGAEHGCALTRAGAVKCWGRNSDGRLGDGTTIDRSTPVPVVGLTSGVVAIGAGDAHSCALTTAGAVKCWGSNRNGRLGDGTVTDSPTPVEVTGLTDGVAAIAVGGAHGCALTSGGAVKCWGYGWSGQLGNGSGDDAPEPVDVVGLGEGIAAIAAGAEHGCALTLSGGVACWGRNDDGQLGDGTTVTRHVPVGVIGAGDGIAAVALGTNHGCALPIAGGARCWGDDSGGQLGSGASGPVTTPVDLAGLPAEAAAIGGGRAHGCALIVDGRVLCRGGNTRGQLGDGTLEARGEPVAVVGLDPRLRTRAGVTIADLPAGSHGVVAEYGGDDRHHGSSSRSVALVVAPAATTTGLAAAPTAPVSGQPLVLTAPVATAGGTPGGDVEFLDGSVPLGRAPLVDAVATLPLPAPAVGGHSLIARYLGDGNHGPSTSPTVSRTVAKGATTTALAASDVAPPFGTTVTLTATVGPKAPATGAVTGTVTFSEGAAVLAVVPLVEGRAATSFAASGLGRHPIAARYGGDDRFTGSAASIAVTVARTPTVTAVGAARSSSVTGQPLALTARVSGGGTPTGTLSFRRDGGSGLATTALVDGVATSTIAALPIGPHTITAVYGGDATHAGSTAAEVSHTVLPGSTTTALGLSATRVLPGTTVTLAAIVAAVAPATGMPSGTVAFRDGATTVGTATLASGRATLTTTALATGVHVLSAVHSGSTTFTASTATTKTLRVDPRVGSEFRVNAVTTGSQIGPAVAPLAGGGFVVVWVSAMADGVGRAVRLQRFGADGSRLGSETTVDGGGSSIRSGPAVTTTADGGFVVAWLATAVDGTPLGIRGQRFSSSGAKLGGETRLDDAMRTIRTPPALAARPGGGFVAAWIAATAGATTFEVRSRVFDGAGTVGAETRIGGATAATTTGAPSLAALTGGGWVAVWAGATSPFVEARRLGADGAPLGGEIGVTSDTWSAVEPSVAGTADGGFVVVWSSAARDGAGRGVFGRRFAADGSATGNLFRANTTTAGDQAEARVAARPGGGFTVVWTSAEADGAPAGVHAQRFAANGARLDVEFRLDTTPANAKSRPSMTIPTATDFVAVWVSAGQDGSAEGIFGQRFAVAGP